MAPSIYAPGVASGAPFRSRGDLPYGEQIAILFTNRVLAPRVRVLLSFDWVPSPGPPAREPGGVAPAARIDRSAKQIMTQPVMFEFDSARILPESEPTLSAVAKLLTEEPRMKVRIEGHTDNVGEAPYNRELSEQRAASVLEWLVRHGIDAARLTSVGRGRENPVASNDTESGRQKNRRVEFIIVEPP